MKTKTLKTSVTTTILILTMAILQFTLSGLSFSKENTHSLRFNLSVADELQDELRSDGRLFLFFGTKPNVEPRFDLFGMQNTCVFAKNYFAWDAKKEISIIYSEGWDVFQPSNFLVTNDKETGWHVQNEWGFENVPEGTYYLQCLWDQNTEESRINSTGNLYSKPTVIEVNGSLDIDLVLTEIVPSLKVLEHELIKEVMFQSDTLSKWWGKPVILKAAVLLPSDYYKNQDIEYPIRYELPGYGIRYTNVNNRMREKGFRDWWLSGEAPQVINVYLDGIGPYGDSFQIDSEAGPYGYALIYEFIPFIEKKFRGTQSSETRFVSGCSGGGWSSLALQLYYPEKFNGVFSYAPGPIDFKNFFLVDIYNDKNMYINEFGYTRPIVRSIYGEPLLSMKDIIGWERVLSPANSYMGSRWSLSNYMALYSPRNENGEPLSLFDEETGKIDPKVAEYWKKYDLLLYLKANWSGLGPKLQGKIYIMVGDMDNSYSNVGVRSFDDFLKSTESPKSDAVIEFIPMYGHCQGSSQYNRIMKVAERLAEIESSNNNNWP